MTKKTIWNRNYIFCMMISTAAAVGHGMLNPALPVYAQNLGLATDIIGIIMAFAMFICMFGRGFIGGCSDRVSKKKLVCWSLLILMSGYICFLFAKNIPLMLLAKTLQAVGQGMVNTVLSTLAFSSIPPEKMASGIGMFSLATSLAQCFAPNLGTEFAYGNQFSLLFLVSLAMTLVSLIILNFIVEPKMEHQKQRRTDRKLCLRDFICIPAIPAAIMLLFNGIIYSSISNYLSLYGLERGFDRIGIFFTINSIVMLVTRPLTGKICDTKPLLLIMLPGYLTKICACLLIANAGSLAAICMAAGCYGFGFGSTQAAIQIMAIRSVGSEQRGKANGTFYVGGDIGLSCGSLVAGTLAKNVGYDHMYMTMAVIAAACLAFYLIYQYAGQRETIFEKLHQYKEERKW